MSENRYSTYILYASGEIILVVIGILIALSIDNWNEERKLHKEINDYLILMAENLKTDSIYYSHNLKSIDNRLEYLTAVSKGNYEQVELDSFIIVIQFELDEMNISPSYISLTELGIMNKIKNRDLVHQIRNYYEVQCKAYNNYVDWHSNFVSENVEHFIVENLPVSRNRNVDAQALIDELENRRLLSIVNYQISNYEYYLNYIRPNQDTVAELIQMIEEEIK